MIAIIVIQSIIICALSCVMVYLLTKKEIKEKPSIDIKEKPSIDIKEKERQEKIDNSFRELMAYTEHIAVNGKGK